MRAGVSYVGVRLTGTPSGFLVLRFAADVTTGFCLLQSRLRVVCSSVSLNLQSTRSFSFCVVGIRFRVVHGVLASVSIVLLVVAFCRRHSSSLGSDDAHLACN